MNPKPAAGHVWRSRLPGLALAAAIGLLCLGLARIPAVANLGLSALPLAILVGMLLGNTVFPRISAATGAGVDYAKSMVLRAGIVLFGFRLTFQDILDVGLAGVLVAVVIVASVFVLATWLGTRVFKLDRDTSMLIGAGAAICGAAAVMAAEPVVKAQAHKVSVAVATVVVAGTVAMFLYPFLYPWLQSSFAFSAHDYGLYTGSTVHEVAQVVVAGRAVSQEAANIAVIEKMIRVILLAPFLLALSAWMRARSGGEGKSKLVIPWFAVLFLLVGAFNSLHLLPKPVVEAILQFDLFLLASAMAALGLRTHVGAIRQAGMKPMLLAAVLFAYLVFGGLAINLAARALA